MGGGKIMGTLDCRWVLEWQEPVYFSSSDCFCFLSEIGKQSHYLCMAGSMILFFMFISLWLLCFRINYSLSIVKMHFLHQTMKFWFIKRNRKFLLLPYSLSWVVSQNQLISGKGKNKIHKLCQWLILPPQHVFFTSFSCSVTDYVHDAFSFL